MVWQIFSASPPLGVFPEKSADQSATVQIYALPPSLKTEGKGFSALFGSLGRAENRKAVLRQRRRGGGDAQFTLREVRHDRHDSHGIEGVQNGNGEDDNALHTVCRQSSAENDDRGQGGKACFPVENSPKILSFGVGAVKVMAPGERRARGATVVAPRAFSAFFAEAWAVATPQWMNRPQTKRTPRGAEVSCLPRATALPREPLRRRRLFLRYSVGTAFLFRIPTTVPGETMKADGA